jgi:hypothetical protein
VVLAESKDVETRVVGKVDSFHQVGDGLGRGCPETIRLRARVPKL